jgi:hypothetical protein
MPRSRRRKEASGYELPILQQQISNARARENISTTWYSEWDRFTQQQVQSVLLRQIKPAQSARGRRRR